MKDNAIASEKSAYNLSNRITIKDLGECPRKPIYI